MRPAQDAADDASALMRRLGLTRAEAEVALSISDGVSVAEIAEMRGVSLHTVRDQIKAAMTKAETSRRSAFVRVILELRRLH
jgi:DNA-binding CsgD family transcriptional regulator